MKPFDVYSVFDLEVSKAQGSKVWDHLGNEYLDLYGGHAVISVGHSHPHYVRAISEQLQKIGFYSNSVRIRQQEELAFRLGTLSGYNDYDLFLCNSGAEANENALKLASFHNGRKKVIAFKGAFHGRTSLAVAATDNPWISAPVNGVHDVTFLPLNDQEAFSDAMSDEVCAVIIEGIQGVGGINIPGPEFLSVVEKLCLKHGAMLILDEVQSGYCRTGKFFAHQHAGIRPHIITVAKGMGNGFPVAGVLISPEIKPVKEMLGTTFGGNYLACAAALAVLDIIDNEGLMQNAALMGRYLADSLAGSAGIRELRICGLMAGIELSGPCAVVRRDLLAGHRIFTGASSDKNTIRLLPSLAIGRQEIDQFVSALQASIKTCTEKDEILHHC